MCTTIEHPFDPAYLSRLPLGPGPMEPLVPSPTASWAGGGEGAFGTGWSHQPRPKVTILSRLVVPTGTKAPSA